MTVGGVCYRSLIVINPSAASLYRTVDRYHPTLCIDEANFAADSEDTGALMQMDDLFLLEGKVAVDARLIELLDSPGMLSVFVEDGAAEYPLEGALNAAAALIEACGQDAETAAAREILEEVGLRCFALRPIRLMYLGGAEQFVLQVFATEAFEGEIVASDEVTDYRWVRLDEVGRFKTTDGLRDVLERAFAIFDRT